VSDKESKTQFTLLRQQRSGLGSKTEWWGSRNRKEGKKEGRKEGKGREGERKEGRKKKGLMMKI
jgi:hypothetical protein